MMSYLWILLLGSLLAAGANAQDDPAPAEEEVAPEAAGPDVTGETDAAAETDNTAGEILPAAPKTTAEPEAEAGESVAPADDNNDAAAPADDNTDAAAPADENTDAAAPVEDNKDAAAPVEDNKDAAAPADDTTDAAAPAAGDTEGVNDPEPEVPKANGEEESTAGADTPAQEETGPDGGALPGTDAGEDTKEPPTDPAADDNTKDAVVEENVVSVVRTGVGALSPNADDVAVHEGNAAHAAGATGGDQPTTGGSSSSSLAAILCAIAAAAVAAVAAYFTYQRKQLCFKNRQEADPEAARKADAAEAQADPQVLSNLLNSS